MNTVQCIKTRRSTRKFSKHIVEQEKLDEIVEAGRLAPSGGNSQLCHFIVVRNKEVLDTLARLVKEEFAKMEYDDTTYRSKVNSIRASKSGRYVFHYDPPVLIIVANRLDHPNHMVDSACALENMMLTANELDLGSCWINQLHWLDENEVVHAEMKKLGLQDGETVCGALALGYPDGELLRSPLPRTGNKVTYID